MLHEETSQPKASGISSEAGRPYPDSEPHSQSLQTQIQNRNLQGSESICHASTRPPASQSTAPHFRPVWTE